MYAVLRQPGKNYPLHEALQTSAPVTCKRERRCAYGHSYKTILPILGEYEFLHGGIHVQ